jgi:uncharacterized protein (DUF2147 family)
MRVSGFPMTYLPTVQTVSSLIAKTILIAAIAFALLAAIAYALKWFTLAPAQPPPVTARSPTPQPIPQPAAPPPPTLQPIPTVFVTEPGPLTDSPPAEEVVHTQPAELVMVPAATPAAAASVAAQPIALNPVGPSNICGFWITYDGKKRESVVVIYPSGDTWYGRIIASFDKTTGQIDDSIHNPVKRAELPNKPFCSGLDFIWDLKLDREEYKGNILNPLNGKTYTAVVRREESNLSVRGQLSSTGFGSLLGAARTWKPATYADFPGGFMVPKPGTFIPKIPINIK